jgi:hypothetical protein
VLNYTGMSLILLVFVYLLALVVTARPILPHAELYVLYYSVNPKLILPVVTVRKIRFRMPCETHLSRGQGESCSLSFASKYSLALHHRNSARLLFPGEKNIYVRITSPRQQTAYLAQLDDITDKYLAPLTSSNVQKNKPILYDAQGDLGDADSSVRIVTEHNAHPESPVQLAPLDGDNLVTTKALEPSSASSDAPLPAPSLVVTISSCIAALVGLLGICIALYIVAFLRSRALAYQTAWEMLPRLPRQIKDDDGENGSRGEQRPNLVDLKSCELQAQVPLLLNVDLVQAESRATIAEGNDANSIDLITFEDDLVVEEVSSDDDDFQDAISNPPTPKFEFLPEIVLSSAKDDYPDPPLPSLNPGQGTSPAPRSPARTLLEMREVNSSPLLRPAWSLRADEDTSLYVPSPFTPSRSPSRSTQTLPPSASDIFLMAVPARQRAYRSPVPEFDIALAMQLRPGLGLGADSAWMVRFLMAMFGWFTVLLTGKKERQQLRLAT